MFLKIGALGFGGLGATLGLMEREMADRQQVLSREEILESLTYTKLLPGSTGAQVVSFLGWRLRRWPGALVSAAAFQAPSVASMLGIAVLYVRFAGLPHMDLALQGMAAAIVWLLVVAIWRLAQANVVDIAGAALALAVFLVGYRMHLPPTSIVLLRGILGIMLDWRRKGDTR